MNTWNELTVHVNREAEEAVSNLLIETGSQGLPLVTRLIILDRRIVSASFILRWSNLI